MKFRRHLRAVVVLGGLLSCSCEAPREPGGQPAVAEGWVAGATAATGWPRVELRGVPRAIHRIDSETGFLVVMEDGACWTVSYSGAAGFGSPAPVAVPDGILARTRDEEVLLLEGGEVLGLSSGSYRAIGRIAAGGWSDVRIAATGDASGAGKILAAAHRTAGEEQPRIQIFRLPSGERLSSRRLGAVSVRSIAIGPGGEFAFVWVQPRATDPAPARPGLLWTLPVQGAGRSLWTPAPETGNGDMAVSGDGRFVVLPAEKGVLVFDRRRRRWRIDAAGAGAMAQLEVARATWQGVPATGPLVFGDLRSGIAWQPEMSDVKGWCPTAVGADRDGTTVVLGTRDGRLFAAPVPFSVRGRETLREFDPVATMPLAPGRAVIGVNDACDTAQLFLGGKPTPAASITTPGPPLLVSASADAGTFAVARFGASTVRVSQVEGDVRKDSEFPVSLITALACSRDGRTVAWGSLEGEVAVIDCGSGDQLFRERIWPDGEIVSLALDPLGRWLAVASGELPVVLVSLLPGTPHRTELPGGRAIHDWLAASPDGEWLTSLASGGWLRVWEIATGELAWQDRDIAPGTADAVSFSEDAAWLFAQSWSNCISVFEAPSFRLRGRLRGRIKERCVSGVGREVFLLSGKGSVWRVEVAWDWEPDSPDPDLEPGLGSGRDVGRDALNRLFELGLAAPSRAAELASGAGLGPARDEAAWEDLVRGLESEDPGMRMQSGERLLSLDGSLRRTDFPASEDPEVEAALDGLLERYAKQWWLGDKPGRLQRHRLLTRLCLVAVRRPEQGRVVREAIDRLARECRDAHMDRDIEGARRWIDSISPPSGE